MRTLGTNTATLVEGPVTEPRYLVTLGFAVPVRFSTAGTVTYASHTYLDADVKISFGDSPSLSILNESTQIGQIVLTEGTAGRSVTILQYYDLTEPETVFDGQMGAATIGERVTIACRRRPPHRTPRDYIGEPVFRHLPRPGTRIVTPKQIITLE